MKKIIVLVISVIMLMCLFPVMAFGETSNCDKEVKVNEKLDALLLSVKDERIKEQLYNYFYLPAYSKESECSEGIVNSKVDEMIKNSEQNYLLALQLLSLDKDAFDKSMGELISAGAETISKMKDIVVEDDYIDYVKPYVSDSVIKVLSEKN